MDPAIVESFRTLRAEIGREAYVNPALNVDPWESQEPCVATIYPVGILRSDTAFRVYAPSFEALLSQVRTAWAKKSKDHEVKVIRDIATAIIRITADVGHCTDTALVRHGLHKDDVVRYAKKAAKEANTMAANGPFSVVMGTANEVE